jgi:hypothetical protein
MSRLHIRIALTNGDESGLVESECKKLIASCCSRMDSAVRA